LDDLGEPERALAILEPLFDAEDPDWVAEWSYNAAGQAWMNLGEIEKARRCFERAVELAPSQSIFRTGLLEAALAGGDPADFERVLEDGMRFMRSNSNYLNNAAWFLATGQHVQERDANAAVGYAERAVAIDPEDGNSWNTVGVARYYAGDVEGAVEALLKSMQLAQGGMVVDWLFLAMAYHRLGDAQSAGFWHQRAVLWMDEHPGEYDVEFDRFRAEADELLGR
jgi:tetratricopeptide (TPR) repeat protein